MEIISDLHIRSRFARATSKSINIENLERYARIKGLNLLGTGDFTHPIWLSEIKDQLKDNGKLMIPVGRMISQLELIEKINGRIKRTNLGGCAFVPLIGKHGF